MNADDKKNEFYFVLEVYLFVYDAEKERERERKFEWGVETGENVCRWISRCVASLQVTVTPT